MATALELGRKGWGKFLGAARSKPLPPKLSQSKRNEGEQLLNRIRKAATALKKRFHARRVILFGSLAHEAWFTSDSDVDLVVEGLTGDDYWQAWQLAEEVIGDRPVDLIEIEAAGETLRQAVQNYGVEL